VLAARSPQELRAAEDELRRDGARDVLAVPTDVTDPAQCRQLVARAVERFGRVDVLINNAGTIIVGPLAAMTEDDFRNVLATNYLGPFHTTMAVLPQMRAQRFGRIANVSSIGGLVAAPHLAPYTVSKYALTGFTRALRSELSRDNILVTGVYPMTIRTGGHTHAWFKGDHKAEYTWFSLSDTVPGLSASADRAARAVLRGVCDGDPEVIVGLPARLATAAAHLFPNAMAELLTLIERALPAPVNLDAPAVQGQDLQGAIPGLLNRLVPGAARP
jgi:NAD(P)-dependent dehydrogenase (short-subunit alcohol dehydrogenase family)